jgi:hypothetical protein
MAAMQPPAIIDADADFDEQVVTYTDFSNDSDGPADLWVLVGCARTSNRYYSS